VNSGAVLELACPDVTCEVLLTDTDVEKAVSADDFARYEQFSFLAHLREEPDACWCPVIGCEAGAVAERSHVDFPKITCPTDPTHLFCFLCHLIWHQNLTCDQARALEEKQRNHAERKRIKDEEKATAKYFKKNKTVRCFKCKRTVAKVSGCNHSTSWVSVSH
jgi:IBR domain, a half RING-finger domain